MRKGSRKPQVGKLGQAFPFLDFCWQLYQVWTFTLWKFLFMLDLKEESKAQRDQRGLLDSLTEGHRNKDKEDAKEREEGNAE